MVISKIKKAINHKTSKERYITALDIGTEYVKALIGRVTTDPENESEQMVEVVGVGRQHQRLTDMQSGAISDIAGVVENCDAALAQAEERSGATANDAVIGIAGELVKGSTLTIRYKRANAEKPIEKSELEHIVKKVRERAQTRAQAEMAQESGNADLEIKLVNAAIVNVQIDGYKVHNPVGFQGRDVAVQLFTAFAPMVHIGALERVAFDLDLNLMSIAAEPFAVAKSVGEQANENFSAVFMDVGGGTTDIALVNEGGVQGTKMFGIGGRSFTQSVAREMNLDFKEAEKLKLEVSGGNVDDARHRQVREALLPTVKVWLSGVELALDEFENIDQLPNTILLCGGGSGLPYVLKALESDKWRHDLPFAKDLQVKHIEPKQVERVVDSTGELKDYTFITPMGLLNLGIDAAQSDSISKSLLERFNRAMQV